MNCRCKAIGLVLVAAFALGAPLEAHAQGGFWEWVHRMSGPEFKTTLGARVSYCLNRQAPRERGADPRCIELGSAMIGTQDAATSGFAPPSGRNETNRGFALTRSNGGPRTEDFFAAGDTPPSANTGQRDPRVQRSAVEWLVGLTVQYGWGGDNDDRQISDVRMLMLEPHLRLMVTGVPAGSLVFGVGLGSHRFWHGTVPDPFWSVALVLVGAYRFELLEDDDGFPTLFVETGVRGRYFFDQPRSQLFGGIPEPGAGGGEMVPSLYIGAGYRFNIVGG